MNTFREKLINEFLSLLKQEDIKKEIKELFKPLIELIIQDIYPYIYISLIFVTISFLLILGIFVLLLKSNYFITPIIPLT